MPFKKLSDSVRKVVIAAAVEQSANSVVITDAEGRIEYANPRFCELTGYSLAELIGENPSVLKSDATLQETYDEMWASISAGNVWKGELLNRRKDGTHYWGHLTISPIVVENGEISHYMGVEENISARKLAEEKLEQTLAELEQANIRLKEVDESRNMFLGIAAHDLRSPISKLVMVSDLLLSEKFDEEERTKFLGIVKRTSTRMLELLNDLLDMAKIESGKIELHTKPTNVLAYFKEIVETNRILGEMKGIALVHEVDEGLPDLVIDPDRLRQVFINLITNAFKFSEGNTTVVLRASKVSGGVRISVEDKGQGIRPDELDRLFQPFEEVSTKPTAGEPSTGLGLAIVKKLVELHGSTIQVESEFGKGSTFSFVIGTVA